MEKTPANSDARKTGPASVMQQLSNERFDSWKEIASYLGRDLRTVRRWEKSKGLPVHRVPGGARAAVFAFRGEIDSWLLNATKETDDSEALTPNSQRILPPKIVGTRDNHAAPISETGEPKKLYLTYASRALAALLFLLTVVAFGLVWARNRHSLLDKVAFAGNSVQGWGQKGELLWSYGFGQPLEESNKQPYRIQVSQNNNLVLVAAPLDIPPQRESQSDALFALSSRGQLRWRYDFHDSIKSSTDSYGPPWFISDLLLAPEGPPSDVWCAANAFFWSTSVLVKLDLYGQPLGQFVN